MVLAPKRIWNNPQWAGVMRKREAMPSCRNPQLRFLWHPGTHDIFSGYGLALGPSHLVGLLMVDRPQRADPTWLEAIHCTFGDYQLTAMTQGGERGIVCQMVVERESIPYLHTPSHPHTAAIRDALLPLLQNLPAVTLALAWYPARRCWVSEIIQNTIPL